MSDSQPPAKAPKSGLLNFAVDFGPLLVFFLAYRHYAPAHADKAPVAEVMAVITGTAWFMGASVIALLVSRWKLGRISPMLWLTTALIVGFGAITIYTQNPDWIRHKPTAIYLLFSALLFGGLWRGRAMLKYLLEAAFEGLDEAGWIKLSRNWAWFFLFLAVLNEAMCLKRGGEYLVSTETWIAAKLWLFMPLSFLFTFIQLPMLMRHGLAAEAKDEVLAEPPHE